MDDITLLRTLLLLESACVKENPLLLLDSAILLQTTTEKINDPLPMNTSFDTPSTIGSLRSLILDLSHGWWQQPESEIYHVAWNVIVQSWLPFVYIFPTATVPSMF